MRSAQQASLAREEVMRGGSDDVSRVLEIEPDRSDVLGRGDDGKYAAVEVDLQGGMGSGYIGVCSKEEGLCWNLLGEVELMLQCSSVLTNQGLVWAASLLWAGIAMDEVVQILSVGWYLTLLEKHHVLTKAVTSVFLTFIGDLIC
ncbi:hypothetical protein LOK49_LG07G01643 [Camellia lanceoleosa]|uniref:Uncharacterized protein n=1 Tax=Camellia lanceoleosa TaxID=1840588 RepID=A0ACC0H313_9ERIC|nr:hypothetical protein LOK49_LG07G01643 [Camellia lanceoleosa]